MVLVAGLGGQFGCEMDSYLDPSEVGRWEVDPVTLPILKRLDSIEEPDTEPPNLTPVMPQDLIPEPVEYVIGPGDAITVSVFELMRPGEEADMTLRISDTGVFRHPLLGDIHAAGLTAPQLEEEVARVVRQKGMLKDPRVTVLVQQGRQNTFFVVAEPGLRSIRPGLYAIIGPDFRLLEALSIAGGMPTLVSKIYVIRQASLMPQEKKSGELETAPAPDPRKVIEDFFKENDEALEPQPEPQRDGPPTSLEETLETAEAAGTWVNIDGKWVRVQRREVTAADGQTVTVVTGMVTQGPTAGPDLPQIVQRVIEVPFEQLAKGDLRFNIVIRPGDIIRIPAPVAGNVFLMGHVARPGTYGLPGDERLTLKRLVAAAGGLDGIAIPQRVDVTRRINKDYEATVRLDFAEIMHGNEPDIYLKADDLINVGTNFIATPLAVIRSGFRMSYGFGFILDRNFGPEVFGPQNRFNN